MDGYVRVWCSLCPYNLLISVPMLALFLQLLRLAEKLGDARKQAAGGASIQNAMIEAQGDVSFHYRHELALHCIPAWDPPSRTHPQHECLFRQRNGRRPG